MRLSYLAVATAAAISTSSMAQESSVEASKNIETIQVSGVRSSLDEARDIKRFSDTVVDAISSEDIGQFTDDSIAQAMQRIPGVQIESGDAGTGGDRVSIRGLGPEFVNSTINGRILLSSGDEARGLRKMNFNVFPPSILSGVEVSKGQTANRPENGLAGQVNLQTLRPLDLQGLDVGDYKGNVSLRYEYEDLVGGSGARLNSLVVGKNEKGNLGGYVGLVTSKSKLNIDQLHVNRITTDINVDNDGDGIADTTLTDVSVPTTLNMTPIRSKPERTALATGIQYQSDSGLEVVWDLMYSNFDDKSHRDGAQLLFGDSFSTAVFDANDIEVDERNLLTQFDYSNSTVGSPIDARLVPLDYNNETTNLITGLNFDWQINDTNANLDLYYSEVSYTQDLRHSRLRKSLDTSNISMQLDGEIPIANLQGLDESDGFYFEHAVVRQIALDADNLGATLSFSTDLDHDVIRSIGYGASYSSTNIDSRRSKFPSKTNPEQSDAIVDSALKGELIPDDFMAGLGFQQLRWLTFDLADVAAIDPYVLATGIDDLEVDPAASHRSTEDITAFWGQVNFDTEMAEIPVKGNFGLRAVFTDHSSTAGAVVDGAAAVDVSTGGDYWEYLPSVNMNFSLTDSIALRLGFSKTLTRPDYEDIAPIISVSESQSTDVLGEARSGNVDLNPMTAFNYDITLEHYNQYDGASVLSFFYKDVSDFIIDTRLNSVSVDGYDGLYNLTTAVNFADGEASGVEIGIYQPFDKLIPALEGFGISANYTYVDSSFDKDVGDAGFGFPGSSQDNFNFIGFYETELYTVRLAYVYRGEFFRSLAGTGSQTDSARFTAESESLDMNISYRLMENVELQFNVSNLTNDNRRDFVGYDNNFLDYFERGRKYSVTATYKF